ncbi:MAG: aldehyde dehydrogenase family protein [Sinobacteraceae bacterium]|nr:aldehyde dehydrogenase family protein [Nevskiaceae bacterium]
MESFARHWINGVWVDSVDRSEAVTTNPADGSEVCRYADGSLPEAEASIEAARTAYESSSWAHDPRRRARALLEMADALDARRDIIGRMLCLENGKPIGECLHEVAISSAELRFYAGLTRANFGRVMETEPGQMSMIAREPMGVAGIIVPWNAPLILLVRSLGPALAAGCTTVIKHAAQTAGTSALTNEAFAGCASLPAGTVNAFAERGITGAKRIVASPDVDVVSYTGSTHVGKMIMADAAVTLKRLNLELGGSAPCVIFADADIDRTVGALVKAGMIMAGQQCVAASRLIVQESIFPQFSQRLVAALEAMVVGPGLQPNTQLGPLIDHRSRERVETLTASAIAAGARATLAPRRPGGSLAKGSFLSPGVLEIDDPTNPILHQETFGPVLTLQRFATEAEAVRRANDSRFGLAASVWTADLQRGQRVAQKIKAGTVWLNMHGRLAAEIETGGYKESGIGRLHGVQGLEEFLQSKHVAWELGKAGN